MSGIGERAYSNLVMFPAVLQWGNSSFVGAVMRKLLVLSISLLLLMVAIPALCQVRQGVVVDPNKPLEVAVPEAIDKANKIRLREAFEVTLKKIGLPIEECAFITEKTVPLTDTKGKYQYGVQIKYLDVFPKGNPDFLLFIATLGAMNSADLLPFGVDIRYLIAIPCDEKGKERAHVLIGLEDKEFCKTMAPQKFNANLLNLWISTWAIEQLDKAWDVKITITNKE
jgi:hypothetical protein